MIDRETVFDALRNCVTEPKCKDCPWEDCEKIGCKRTTVPVTLLLDTLNLLKEQDEIIDALLKVGYPHNFQREPRWIVNYMYSITDVVRKAVHLRNEEVKQE